MKPETRFYVPRVRTHLIECASIGQVFQIQVMEPVMQRGSNERFPVLYLTDANLSFDFAKGISHCLQSSGQVRRFILVGIGYPGDNPFAGGVLRCRDMTSAASKEIPGLPRSSPIEGVPGLEADARVWGGADEFLAFIRDQLVGGIDEAYPTLPGERAYFGHSLGGSFGLHALFSPTPIFNKYIISSPGISYDGDDYGIREAQRVIASGRPLPARVAMSVGDQEEFERDYAKSQCVSSVYRLAALLHRSAVAGLEFTCRIIPGETHVSVWPIAFSHGVQAIYGVADHPPTASP